jgi:transcriptional regulator with XRE-family HTH domain
MNRIKEILEEKGIKQTWLTEKLGKIYSIINGYIQNHKQSSIEVLYEIAKILNLDATDLLVKIKK